MLKLGIEIGQATVAKYMVRRVGTLSPTWRTVLCNEAIGIAEVVTAPRSPWQNAYVERVIGSIRREYLDHLVIFNERHLRGVLSSYVDHYHRTRSHLLLRKDCPDPHPIEPPGRCRVIVLPQVGGLHHRYERLAA